MAADSLVPKKFPPHYSIGETDLHQGHSQQTLSDTDSNAKIFGDRSGNAREVGSSGLTDRAASSTGDSRPRPVFSSANEAWQSGLAAWRRSDYGAAAVRFEAVATHPRASSWTLAGGAFWAARAHLFNHDPAKVSHWLEVAADQPDTFYGLLARRILDLPMPFRWEKNARDEAALQTALATPGGQRARALIDAGRADDAERTLESLARSRDTELVHGVMIMAESAGMADLAFRLERKLAQSDIEYPPAAYPIPHWRPEGGYNTDRALIFALMRQESKFRADAVSQAGARGVMQLMPSTARFVARATGLSARDLRSPEVNIALGQRYLEMLLLENSVDNDLFRLTAAWNGGPGNLERWQRTVDDGDDPLLFIETIPAGETRAFIEHVLANLWIYRDRLGRTSPSLDALAAGQWPGYDGAGQNPVEVAEHGQE